MEIETALCGECKRVVRVRKNKFGDKVYARHKIKTAHQNWIDSQNYETRADALAESYASPNPLAYSESEIDCINSGQPV